ncbi:MAG: nickel pincer cofactor biosynthesis protein LarC [Chthoniobacterales bacterium]
MKILYLDCLSGISGDMSVGALCDLGVEPADINAVLASLGLDSEFHAHYSRQQRQNIDGVKFDVHLHHHHDEAGHHHHHHHHHHEHPHEHAHSHEHGHEHTHDEHTHDHDDEHSHGRSFREIRTLLEKSSLSPFVKKHALSIFSRIAEAEGKIHGMPPEEVTFHEVGSIDSIVDIVAVCAGIETLKVDKILASPLFEGSGSIHCAHGIFPLPAPATLEILKGIPLRQIEDPYEFITPTGAAILAEFVSEYGPMPTMQVEKIGYGIGTRDLKSRPNVLRALLGEIVDSNAADSDEVIQIETNLDDISPEVLAYASEKILLAGALDVFTTPIVMKKNRPAFLLTVLCDHSQVEKIETLIFQETTAFGLRRTVVQRSKLQREIRDVSTPWGPVSVKFGYRKGILLQASPEFDSCAAIAKKADVPISEVYRAALTATPSA